MTRLHALHAPGRLLVLPNAWDALSARLVEEAGAEAVATSSASLSWSHGHPDGERIPLDDVVRAVARIARVVKVPLTVDLERGYGADPAAAAEAVARVVDAGAEGVNLEDGGAPAEKLAETMAAVRRRLENRVFVNARTCVVLRGMVEKERLVEEVLARARRFADGGADGLFVPGLTDEASIQSIVRGTSLPLNVLIGPGLPSVDRLRALGVRRLSSGPRLAEVAYSAARHAARDLLERGSADRLLATDLTYAEGNRLFSDRPREEE